MNTHDFELWCKAHCLRIEPAGESWHEACVMGRVSCAPLYDQASYEDALALVQRGDAVITLAEKKAGQDWWRIPTTCPTKPDLSDTPDTVYDAWVAEVGESPWVDHVRAEEIETRDMLASEFPRKDGETDDEYGSRLVDLAEQRGLECLPALPQVTKPGYYFTEDYSRPALANDEIIYSYEYDGVTTALVLLPFDEGDGDEDEE